MRPIDVHTEATSVRVSRIAIPAASSRESSRNALSFIWTRLHSYPAIAFTFLSIAFGSIRHLRYSASARTGRDFLFFAHLLLSEHPDGLHRNDIRPERPLALTVFDHPSSSPLSRHEAGRNLAMQRSTRHA